MSTRFLVFRSFSQHSNASVYQSGMSRSILPVCSCNVCVLQMQPFLSLLLGLRFCPSYKARPMRDAKQKVYHHALPVQLADPADKPKEFTDLYKSIVKSDDPAKVPTIIGELQILCSARYGSTTSICACRCPCSSVG